MKKSLFSFLIIAFACICAHAQEPSVHQRFVGGDISMLPMYEQHNSYYKDVNGAKINDLLTWLVQECGWNTFRVRLFYNPTEGNGVVQDLPYVTSLGKRIKDAGAYFMLDFHYSDTWVDATHIQAPAAWKGLSDAVMADSVDAYTRRVLNTLIAAGAKPDLVQVGNEIMYGLCGIQVHPYDKAGDNWDGYLNLLKAGCNAVRELCPDAQIIIHTDRPTNSGYNSFYYNKLINNNVDFDVIGLSYYPFWHGYLTPEQVKDKSDKNNLVNALNNLATWFPDKRVQIVECAYNFQYWPKQGVNTDTQDAWPCSKAGQYQFVRDLVDALKPLKNVDGINYWFPEEAGNGDDTNWNTSKGTVITTWLNRGFWDEGISKSGHAINRTGAPTGDQTAEDVCAPYYMKNFLDNPSEGIEQSSTQALRCEKRLQNGQIVLLVNGKPYNILGAQMEK
ncbi:MAG: glycosyl hydrolase 53 family protein [Paludibacteraceae bacterium]|nr:glycosyl hydrolase 53 family protein [Paludibacteraceae bacterium]